jgi:hypothetical protein
MNFMIMPLLIRGGLRYKYTPDARSFPQSPNFISTRPLISEAPGRHSGCRIVTRFQGSWALKSSALRDI